MIEEHQERGCEILCALPRPNNWPNPASRLLHPGGAGILRKLSVAPLFYSSFALGSNGGRP